MAGLSRRYTTSLGTAFATPTVSRGALPRGPALERLEQLAAGGEDLRRVPIDDTTDVGQHQRAALTLKQPLAERLLEQLELRADRRLRHAQLLGRARNPPLAHDGPEIEQVVVVERLHRRPRTKHSKNRSRRSELSICQ